jgi:Neocarzinostatin family
MHAVRAITALGIVFAGFLIAAPPASADGPSITVAPSTGLTDGQTVTVSGTGFTVPTPHFLAIGECANVTSPGFGDCDQSTVNTSVVNTEDFVETYTVARFITTANHGALDCAVPTACTLAVQAFTLQSNQVVAAPISFSTTVPNLRILNARLIHSVSPGEPVELVVRAVNDGSVPANWSISQSNDVGLTVLRTTCPGGSAQGPGTCVYTPAQRGVDQPAIAVFTVEAAPGFTGTAYATVCATDIDNPGSAPPSNMCEVITTTVG